MNTMLEDLTGWGADVPGALDWFCDDEEMYRDCLQIFLTDENFEALNSFIAAKEYEKAFDAAHSLKGVAGNLGLTPLYAVICTIVEALRHGDHSALDSQYADVMLSFHEFSHICNIH